MAERRLRSPGEVAKAALDVQDRKIAKVKAKLDELKKQVGPLEQELAALIRRRDFLATDPDLPANQPKPVKDTEVDKPVPPAKKAVGG